MFYKNKYLELLVESRSTQEALDLWKRKYAELKTKYDTPAQDIIIYGSSHECVKMPKVSNFLGTEVREESGKWVVDINTVDETLFPSSSCTFDYRCDAAAFAEQVYRYYQWIAPEERIMFWR